MRCPTCDSDQIKVINSRDTVGNKIYRRRECIKCETRFTTYEQIGPLKIDVCKLEDLFKEIITATKVASNLINK